MRLVQISQAHAPTTAALAHHQANSHVAKIWELWVESARPNLQTSICIHLPKPILKRMLLVLLPHVLMMYLMEPLQQ